MPKLYTKTGDKGKTSLRSGRRVSKAEALVEAYGTVDELNSTIAVAIAEIRNLSVNKLLIKVQSDLFHIGTILAGEKEYREERLKFLNKRVSELEDQIDKLQKRLPMQKGFVLPGGAKPSAYLDFARAVCRRAERRVSGLSKMEKIAVKYLNRLSDYLYCLARWANFKLEKNEIKWKNNFYSST